MRIVRLTAENIKRLSAVEITPTGDVVIVAGKNGQGKTSVLDSIWFALGGQSAQKETAKPVRAGEDHAEVTLDLGDIVVTRRWNAEGKSTLTVTGKDGARFPSPQSMLDSLVGRLSFDPLAFSQQDERSQLKTLLDLVDLPFNPEEVDANRKTAFDRRTEVNRAVKEMAAQLKSLPAIPRGTPDEEVSAGEVLESIRAAEGWQSTDRNLKAERARVAARILELQNELLLEQEKLTGIDGDIGGLPNPLPDPAQYTEQLEKLEDTNRWVRVKKDKERLQTQHETLKKEADTLTTYLADLDKYKEDAIQNAVMPIRGLGFDDEGVTYGGIPFKQASSAEQLKVSVAMAMALNPQVRVIRITDGSLLDSDNLAIIGQMAADHDYQVWIERVDESGQVGVVIEDGMVKA